MSSDETIPGYILCGGRSARFGSDKARAEIEGVAMIRRVADRVESACSPVFAVAEAAGKHDDLGLETLGDERPGDGPMGGLLTSLRHRLGSFGHGWLVLAACDTPWLDPASLDLVLHARGEGVLVSCFRTDRMQPMPGAYHTELVGEVERRVGAGELAMHGLIAGVPASVLMASERDRTFRQVTRPGDVAGG